MVSLTAIISGKCGTACAGDQPILAVERAGQPDDAVIQRGKHAVEIARLGERRPDRGIDMRVAGQQHAVARIERERGRHRLSAILEKSCSK